MEGTGRASEEAIVAQKRKVQWLREQLAQEVLAQQEIEAASDALKVNAQHYVSITASSGKPPRCWNMYSSMVKLINCLRQATPTPSPVNQRAAKRARSAGSMPLRW